MFYDREMEKARQMITNKQLGEAMDVVDKILMHYPYAADAIALKGDILKLSNMYSDAIDTYMKASNIKSDPKHKFEHRIKAAQICIKMRDTNLASEILNTTIDEINSLPDANYSEYLVMQKQSLDLTLAQLYKTQKRFDEALEILNRLYFTSNKKYALSELILVSAEVGRYEDSFRYARELYRIGDFKEKMMSKYYRGVLLKDMGNIAKAVSFFEGVILSKRYLPDGKYECPTNSFSKSALIRLVEMYLGMSDYDKAYEVINKYRKYFSDYSFIDPMDFFTRYNLNLLRDSDYDTDDYSRLQIMDYSRERALEHIALHRDSDMRAYVFNDDIDIAKLYDECRRVLLTREKVATLKQFSQRATLSVSEVGMFKDQYLNEVDVVCVAHQPKKILTMFPTNHFNEIKEYDIDRAKVRRIN